MRGVPALPIADGWFRVGFLEALAPGSVEAVRYFGRDLVLFVTEGGTPALFEAHCPHLGAHLGIGGRVEGESLRCPFHAWRFDTSGSCVEAPYAKRIPAGARARTVPTRTRDGIVWAWHHAGGQAPSWEPPALPELADPAWTPLVHHRWTVRTRNQEIVENSADPAHFPSVHGFDHLPTPELRFEDVRLRSLSHFETRKAEGVVRTRLEVTWYGLGLGVTRTSGALDQLFLGTATPIDAETLDLRFSFSLDNSKGLSPDHGLGRASIAESIRQLEQDIPIWENKTYHARPLLSDADGPIPAFRRWAAQFYSADAETASTP